MLLNLFASISEFQELHSLLPHCFQELQVYCEKPSTEGGWVQAREILILNTRPYCNQKLKTHCAVKILKFGVNQANIEEDNAILKLENLLRDVRTHRLVVSAGRVSVR